MIPTGASFSVGDVLGKGFSTFFKNLPAFIVMAVVVYLPMILYGLVAKSPLEVSNIEEWQTQTFIFLAVMILGGLLLSQVMSAAVTYAVVEELNGRHAPIGKSIGVGLRRMLPALAVGILSGLCIALGAVLLIIPGLIVMCMLYVAVPASVVEAPGVGGALSRSAFLTKGHRWGIFGIIIIMAILSAAINFVLESALVDKTTVGDTEVINPGDWKTYVFVNIGVQIIMGALGAVIAATAYVSLRNDKDGVGVGELARVFD
jgi:hypothetical protein